MIIVGDLHFSETSSLLPRGDKETLSIRLQNIKDTIGWIISMSKGQRVVQLGDFFDKKLLTGNELICLKDLVDKYNGEFKAWDVLTGNHGIDTAGDSTFALPCTIHTKVSSECLGSISIAYIPYTPQKEMLSLKSTLDSLNLTGKVVVLSHNNIQELTKAGYSLQEIESSCDLFLNGHIHKAERIGKYVSVGNVTGQNFSEEALDSKHGIWELNEKTLELTFLENPYALLYTHLDLTDPDMTPEIREEIGQKLSKDRTLMAVTAWSDEWEKYQPWVAANSLKYRPILKHKPAKSILKEKQVEQRKSVIERFVESAREKFGEIPVLKEVTNDITKSKA